MRDASRADAASSSALRLLLPLVLLLCIATEVELSPLMLCILEEAKEEVGERTAAASDDEDEGLFPRIIMIEVPIWFSTEGERSRC